MTKENRDTNIDFVEKEKEPLPCNRKCINNVAGICIINDWSCRNKLDIQDMKFINWI